MLGMLNACLQPHTVVACARIPCAHVMCVAVSRVHLVCVCVTAAGGGRQNYRHVLGQVRRWGPGQRPHRQTEELHRKLFRCAFFDDRVVLCGIFSRPAQPACLLITL